MTVESEPLEKYILLLNGTAQVFDENLGAEVDVYLTADLETLGRTWFGEVSPEAACDKCLMKVVGNRFYTQNLSRWIGAS